MRCICKDTLLSFPHNHTVFLANTVLLGRLCQLHKVRLKRGGGPPPRAAPCPTRDTDFNALEHPAWQVPVLRSNKK